MGQAAGLGWRLQLLLIIVAAFVLRGIFFVGFALGDDLGYVASADLVLNGHYPSLILNQYAYRPLLNALFAAGIAVFGHTDVGVVAPVFVASLVTTALVFLFVRKLLDPAAAWWCAILFAFHPFNVVDSTTMTNDVILSCLAFAATGAFLIADRSATARQARRLFATAGLLMGAAFLVKVAILPALCCLGLYSLVALVRRPGTPCSDIRPSTCRSCVCWPSRASCNYVKTGDWFFQLSLNSRITRRTSRTPISSKALMSTIRRGRIPAVSSAGRTTIHFGISRTACCSGCSFQPR